MVTIAVSVVPTIADWRWTVATVPLISIAVKIITGFAAGKVTIRVVAACVRISEIAF